MHLHHQTVITALTKSLEKLGNSDFNELNVHTPESYHVSPQQQGQKNTTKNMIHHFPQPFNFARRLSEPYTV